MPAYNNSQEDEEGIYNCKNMIIKNYKILNYIGKGTFGKVY